MRYLIVNADDFGASPGINRGILDAHTAGIVTSTSLMVDTPWSAEAAVLRRAATELSVGLHVVLDADVAAGPNRDGEIGPGRVRDELRRQLARFEELMGCSPTHLDSHHNAHCDPRVLAAFLDCSRSTGLPLRGYSRVRYFAKFYGRWSGESHPEQVSVESLTHMLRCEIGAGTTELSCHPGYFDPGVPSDYALERVAELRTLCDPRISAELEAQGITRLGFHELSRVTATELGA
jgi:predicted glycoside hydrolase/deacetylase ChbG (UPF0249 family)